MLLDGRHRGRHYRRGWRGCRRNSRWRDYRGRWFHHRRGRGRFGARRYSRRPFAFRHFATANREADGLNDDVAHFSGPVEAHFLFGGMDIDIHRVGRHAHLHEQRRIAPPHQHIAVGALDGKRNHWRTGGTLIDEHNLPFAVQPAKRWHAGIAADFHRAVAEVQRAQVGGHLRAIQIADAVQQRACRQPVHIGIVRAQDEFHGWIRQRLVDERLPDVCELGGRRAQKLAARRHIKKQIAHGDVRARRHAGIAHLLNAPAEYQNLRAGGRACAVGKQRELRHGGNRGEGLAAEAHRGDVIQILQRAQLAGGMALQRQKGIIAVHARAIIAHADKTATAIHHIHLDAPRAGIQRVFYQLLEHGCRTFDHFTCGDLVDHRVRQHTNLGGGIHGMGF